MSTFETNGARRRCHEIDVIGESSKLPEQTSPFADNSFNWPMHRAEPVEGPDAKQEAIEQRSHQLRWLPAGTLTLTLRTIEIARSTTASTITALAWNGGGLVSFALSLLRVSWRSARAIKRLGFFERNFHVWIDELK